MQSIALRLKPNQDLKHEILKWAVSENIDAACILTCVGSLNTAELRLANQNQKTHFKGFYEIVSLVGTFSKHSGHFHISIANSSGHVFGGHLLEKCIIHTTAEIVIGILPNTQFDRVLDPATGFKELHVKSI